MKKIMMIYSIPFGNDNTRIRFNRKLINYKIQSHKGKYKTITKGILEKYEKPIRSCIIFYQEKLNEVRKLCKEFKINSKFYKIKEI